jgi:ABC-type phosphate/phosphonate transport system permease subunit
VVPFLVAVAAVELALSSSLDNTWVSVFPFLAEPAGYSFDALFRSREILQQLEGAWWFLALFLVYTAFNTILGEELLFRGVLLPRMAGVFGRWSWAANGLLFGLYHLHQPWGIPKSVLTGLLYAFPAHRFRSTWLSIIVHSGQSVYIAFLVLGVVLGLAAGFYRGWVDWVVSTLVNVMLTFPFVLLALAVIAVLGPSYWNLIVVLSITGWPVYTRILRAQTLSLREREFVQAARALGAHDVRIIARHLFPNVLNLLVVIASLQVAQMIILESFLSFLGLGVQPPIPSWGSMLGDGRLYMFDRWWMATFPGVAIFATTLAINLVGDGLRDLLDPYSRASI